MKLLIALLTLLYSSPALCQEALLPVRIMATPKPAAERFAGTDAFGWDYVIADNEFRKQKDGRVLKYKNVALGDIFRVDLQNPLQIVLFYKKFNTLVLLDNQMNATNLINFNDISEPLLAEAVGLASQNRLWVYDLNTQQTGLFDTAKNTFRTLTPPNNGGITWYQNDYNYFYWTDNNGNLFVLNLFGKINTLGTLPPFDAAQLISNDVLLLQKDNVLYQYQLSTQKSTPVTIIEKTFGAFYYKDGILSIFTNSEIIQYKISLPR
ncbi:hypothetical protein ACLI09_10340 [Flavobacterium sp. RHBU_24]|uniref:hypothetical protein n=1 Tax=Flavobacterium sp. RHBU_24 TaxID=3391185 RepID=UPI00398506BD